jgi:argininosuccinate lyase
LLATDLADYLVRQGIPFREAHGLVGQVVRLAEEKGVPLTSLKMAELKTVSDAFADDVAQLLNVARSLDSRTVEGGTGPAALEAQLAAARAALA